MNLHIFNMLALYLADLLIISDLSSVYIKLFVFFFFYNFRTYRFFFEIAPPCTNSVIRGKKSDAGISSIIYLILAMFNILSYHKLLTYNISNFTSIKYLSQQLRSSYNAHVLGSKSYGKLVINYVLTNSNLTTLLIYKAR